MKDLEGLTVDELVGRYRTAATTHGRGTIEGNSAETNEAANFLSAAYRELRRRNQEAVLSVLLEDPDPSVRGWAGSHVLEFAPDEAEPVLMALAADDLGIISFNAEMTLEEWRAGRLRFP